MKALYEEDRVTAVRLTKLNYTSVHSKILQRQSVPLVCQVFHEKTAAALLTLKGKLHVEEGTVRFINLVTTWFKMMNIKDRYSAVKLSEVAITPWQLQCDSFQKLLGMCEQRSYFIAIRW